MSVTEDSVEITQEDMENISRVAYEANRLYVHVFGLHETLHPPWSEAPEWMQRTVRVGVQAVANNPASTPKDSHISWMKMKLSEGWKYGKVKSADRKEHPCFKPYEELPKEQRAKDRLFIAVARSLLPDLV